MQRPDSWDVLLSRKFKGRITLLDDPQQNIQGASHILGYNPDRLTAPQAAKVKRYLILLKKQARTLTTTNGQQVQLLASGEIDAVFLGWAALDIFITSKGAACKTIVPREGSVGFCDAAFIPPGAANRATALAFCQQLLTPRIAAEAAANLTGGVTAIKAIGDLSPQTKALYPYAHIEDYLGSLVYLPHGFPRSKSRRYLTVEGATQLWEEVKAA